MAFAAILLATIAATIVFRDSLKRQAKWWYRGAAALEILYAAGVVFELPDVLWSPLYLLMQQATLAMALFVIVMFIGALPPAGKLARMLRPIRTELSILACILVVGHMIVYLLCIPRLFTGGLVTAQVLCGFIVAVLLTVLLAVLGPTSAESLKRRLGARRWKAIQRSAYLFYGFTYLHLMLVLMPSIEQGVVPAMVTAAVYTVVFAVYAVARVARAVSEARGFNFAMGHSDTVGQEFDEPLHNVAMGR